MKKCYADKSLKVSADDFERPENISIRLDCDKEDENAPGDDNSPEEEEEEPEF